jgi:hypothetical protein
LVDKRNGEDREGWALRLHGQNKESSFSGLMHDGKSNPFHSDWKVDDKIGMLYNPIKKTLSYYCNGVLLGTPFTDLEGELFVCVETCHLGAFSIVENP